MSDNVLIFPLVRIAPAEDKPLARLADLLHRIDSAICSCNDDDRPGIARIIEESRAEIGRLTLLVEQVKVHVLPPQSGFVMPSEMRSAIYDRLVEIFFP